MIEILLAAYQGEQFLAEQLDSLLAQTEQGFRVLICDDGSRDATFAVASDYAARFPGKFRILKNTVNSGSAARNFISMMTAPPEPGSDYFMLCDQDDVWLPDKISNELAAMHELEARFGSTSPLLVFSDLSVVDRSLQPLAPSFSRMTQLDPARRTLARACAQNTLTGCTALYNRALSLLLMNQTPSFLLMHDWWLFLVATAFGQTSYLPEPTVLYRQHAKNSVGAKDIRRSGFFVGLRRGAKDIRDALRSSYQQAEAFLELYSTELSEEQRQFLLDFSSIAKYSKLKRIYETNRLGVWKTGGLRRLAQLFFL